MSPLFELSPNALMVVTVVGAITAFFAATVGLVQNDIKRVIAYSTCSQLGYMFVALGVGAYGAAVFHLFTHAFFKALLFLAPARSSMPSMANRTCGTWVPAQAHPRHLLDDDHRHAGAHRRRIPGTMIGFAGFFSKDVIIESSFASHSPVAGFAFTLLVIAALFTSFYSWRLAFLTFFGKPRASDHVMHHVHESPAVMLIRSMFWARARFSRCAVRRLFLRPPLCRVLAGRALHGSENEILEEFHHVPLWVKWSPSWPCCSASSPPGTCISSRRQTPKVLAKQHHGLYNFLLNKWYFDELYDFIFVRPAKWLGTFLWKEGDGRVIDGYGRTASPPRHGCHGSCRPPADRLPLPLRIRHAHRYRCARYLDDAREFHVMIDWPVLSAVTFIPLVGVLLLLFTREDSPFGRRNILNVSLLTTLVTFVVSLYVWYHFDSANPGFQMVEKHEWLGSGISYHLGVDGISCSSSCSRPSSCPSACWRAGSRSKSA